MALRSPRKLPLLAGAGHTTRGSGALAPGGPHDRALTYGGTKRPPAWNSGMRGPRAGAQGRSRRPARPHIGDGRDFWKESERRYRQASRLMDEMYWCSLPLAENIVPGKQAGGPRMVVVR